MTFLLCLSVVFLFCNYASYTTGIFLSDNNVVLKLPIIHINDFHARFEETEQDGSSCKSNNCIGGFSRMYKTIMDIRNQTSNSIILNAGDNFQGTLWYTIHKWNVTQYFLNQIPFDATVLGNHEFDDKMVGVVPFMKSLKSPIVLVNVDDSKEPSFQGLYNKSTIIIRDGRKIGIIGVIIKSVNFISNTEKLEFLDEIESVNAEAERLVREENVFTNIILSHSGYPIEQKIAKNAVGKISLVVGGHSHSLLYTGEPVPGPQISEGPYPTVVKGKNGQTVLVVQAGSFNRYVGNLSVSFDENGNCVEWEGNSIFLEHSLPQDPAMNTEIESWKASIDIVGKSVLGSSSVKLDRDNCRRGECLLGNFVTDAMIYSTLDRAEKDYWTYVSIAFVNAGGLRTSIATGNITFSDMMTAQPFENTMDIGEIKGKHLQELLEFSGREYYHGRTFSTLNLLQMSGVRVLMDITKPEGQRIKSIKLRCNECRVPVYENINLDKMYRIMLPSFLTKGGDKFSMFPDYLQNIEVGERDINIFQKYLAAKSPIFQEIEGRIQIIGQEKIVVKKWINN